MTASSFTQVTFRGRNDDGSETAATWIAAAGENWSQNVNTNFRVRFRIDETASRAWTSQTFNLYYSLNSGSYTAIASGQPVKYALSGNFAQGDDCTSQLTGGTGTFVTDNNGMCESAGATNSGTAGYLFEVEYCLQIDSAYVANGDTIQLRVYNGTAAIASYTDTPEITVVEAAPDALTSAGITTGTPTLGAATIGQVHALTSAGVTTGTPVLDAATLGQVHALSSAGITSGTPALGAPTLEEDDGIDDLTAAGITTGAPSVASPTIGQIHDLTTGSLSDTILGLDPITYWPLNETSGTAAVNYGTLGTDANGTYSGATLNQIAAPGGTTAPFLDGVNDYISILSDALNTAFTPTLFTLLGWFKIPTDIWTEVAWRLYLAIGASSSDSYAAIWRNATDYQLQYYYKGTASISVIDSSNGNDNWHLLVITANKASDEFKAYVDTAQIGTTQNGLTDWTGPLLGGMTTIGGQSTYAKGYASHVSILNSVLSLENIQAIYNAGMGAGGGITTGEPVLDAPAIGQKHALTSAGVTTASPTLDAPTIGQKHVLTSAGVTTGNPVFGAPTLAEAGGTVDNLTSAGITSGSPVLDAPTIGQIHALNSAGVTTSAPILGAPTIGQTHALTSAGVTTASPVLGAPTVVCVYALTSAGITTGAPVLGAPTLAAVTILAGRVVGGDAAIDEVVTGGDAAINETVVSSNSEIEVVVGADNYG